MMSFIDLPDFLWRHALFFVIHLLNQVLSKSIPTTPYELWYGKKSIFGYLKIWRCSIHIKRQQMDKLEARSFKAHFIGYPKKTMRYYFYLSEDHNMIVSRHAVFLKKEFIQDEGSGRKIELKDKVFKEHRVQELKPNSEPVDMVPSSSRRSNRISRPPERCLDIPTEN